MQKKVLVTALVFLIIGVGVGYGFGANKSLSQSTPVVQGGKSNSGMHMMPDGTMMGNGGKTMSMSDMMMDMNAELRGKTGDAFDQAFLSEMIVHHEGAVEMAELALSSAKHQEIKDLATAIISAQNKEITSMKSWQKTWYNQ